MDPTVSIIIPAYNYGKYVNAAIRSAIEQNEHPTEIIVVDDASTDDTQSIVKLFGAAVRYIRKESNEGLSAARNTGIEASSGRYLQFLDADDRLGSGAVAARVRMMENDLSIGATVCRNRLFGRGEQGNFGKLLNKRWQLYSKHLGLHLCYANIAPPHAFLVRRDNPVVQEGFDGRMQACEDYDFWVRLAAGGWNPVYCREGEVFYRKHSGSMSSDIVRQLTWDAEMHMRVYRLIQRSRLFPREGKSAGMIALLAGTLYTLYRFHQLKWGAPDKLWRLCLSICEELARVQEQRIQPCTGLLYYYWCKAIESAIRLNGSHKNAGGLFEQLSVLSVNWRVPEKGLRRTEVAFRKALLDRDLSLIERYRLLASAVRSTQMDILDKP